MIQLMGRTIAIGCGKQNENSTKQNEHIVTMYRLRYIMMPTSCCIDVAIEVEDDCHEKYLVRHHHLRWSKLYLLE